MKRAFLLSLALICLRDVGASVACSGLPCADGAAAAGVTSPVTNDPLVFNGATTFDKQITSTLGLATPSAGAANAVEIGTTAGCITLEGATADAFETRLCAADPTVDMVFNTRAPTFAGTNTLLDNAAADNGSQTVAGAMVFSANSSFYSGTANIGPINPGYGMEIFDQARYCFSSTANNVGAADTCVARIVPGVTWFTNGGSADAWTKEAGKVALAADFTNATATQANTTLQVALTAGRNYTFELKLFAANSTAAEGIRLDYDGGSATATNFISHCVISDTAQILSSQTAAIATDVTVATMTGASLVSCAGDIEVNAGGTFIVRAAEATTVVGTLTIKRGSWLIMQDVTPSS
jgi:hypothetical protein